MSTAQIPLVSVLMPVYNAQPYVAEAIDSVLEQDFTDFEFVIIDDGSTDASAEIIQSYDDPRIRFFENRYNTGLIDSLNRGLSRIGSPYIARMDADDISLPHRLARQLEFLDAHPEVGVLGSAVQVIDGSGTPCHVRRFPAENGVIRWRLCFDDPIAHPTVMMRRSIVRAVGGYDADMVHAEDYDLWRRLSPVTRLANLPDVLLHLRRHEACVTRVHHAQQWENSIRTSQLMMSEVLGEDPPIQVAHCLCRNEFEKLNDVRQAVQLVCRLCQAVLADGVLSPAEKRMIRQDAAMRLFSLGHRRTLDGHVWEVLGLACRLDPLVIGRAVAGRLSRAVRERRPS